MAQRRTDSDADYAACRAMIRQGSRTFFAASLILPPRVRTPAYALYAFCRLSDDAVDAPDARRDAVARLSDRLDRLYAGRPRPDPVDRAFADVVARHDLPKALPQALLEGLAWDAENLRYVDLSDLRAYAARVAGTVGAMMTVLMGVRDSDTLARACDLGVAMQLTNIARDVGEDARNGRIYLPLSWLDEAGIHSHELIRDPTFNTRIAPVIARLLASAEELYVRSSGGVAGLPPACRVAIHAARMMYREIGRQVARNGHESLSGRAVVPDSRKLALLAGAMAAAVVGQKGPAAEPLEETRFLVEAAAVASAAPVAAGWPAPLRAVDDRAGWIIDMLDRVEKRRWAQYEPENQGLAIPAGGRR